MNPTLRNFFEALKGADAGTKVVIAVASAAMIGTMAFVGMMSKDEHFVPAFPHVAESDMPAVTKALADAGIPMEVRSSDDGAAVFVPRSQKYDAGAAVFSSGAIQAHGKGILNGDSDGLNIFAGSAERDQYTRAKEMEEVEAMIQSFDYVKLAEIYKREVVTSGLTRATQVSASAIITTRGGFELTNGQKQAISNIFANALGLGPGEYTIADQAGRTIHGGDDDASGVFDDRVLELQRDYNHNEELRINSWLADNLGPNKAEVFITSEFDVTQSTSVSQQAGKPITQRSTEYTVEGPGGPVGGLNGGGVTGTSANLVDPDAYSVNSAGGLPEAVGSIPASSRTSEKETNNVVPMTTRTEVRNQPVLKRLSVSLMLDSSLADQQAELDKIIQNMAGVIDDRDSFTSSIHTFVVPEVVEEAEGEGAEEGAGGFDMNMLLERGVEILTALAFIFLLLKGLKGAKGAATQTEAGELALAGGAVPGPDGEAAEVDPEALARAQVESLVSNNPERVAQILSNWVIEERSGVKS